MATGSGLQNTSPWPPFLGGVCLLTLGGIAGVVGLWLFWHGLAAAFWQPNVSGYEGEHVTGLRTDDAELLQLVRHSGRDEVVSPRVKKILELQAEAWRRGEAQALNLEHWVLELRKLQAAEARELRVKQVKESCLVGFLAGFPMLVVGVLVARFGLRKVRRHSAQVRAELGRRLPGTVFDQGEPIKKPSGSDSIQTPPAPSEIEEPITCLQCGIRIPAAAPKCPACGWSYGAAKEAGVDSTI